MSFSRDVKNELVAQLPRARHCELAEMAAILSMCGIIRISVYDTVEIEVRTENSAVARKFHTLARHCFSVCPQVCVRGNSGNRRVHTYIQVIDDNDEAVNILKAVKLMDHQGNLHENLTLQDSALLSRPCCRKAFIRGCFLATGSVTSPEKSYHFEIVCSDQEKAELLCGLFASFALDAKIVKRKSYYVVYLKEGEMIADALNLMGAHVSLMNLENIRIVKDVRNSVNRRVNCETANLHKTVTAAVRQIQDIEYIRDHGGFDMLSDSLRQTALVRLSEPDMPLKDIGAMLDPPVGKSGVNHRLRKLSAIADDMRGSAAGISGGTKK